MTISLPSGHGSSLSGLIGVLSACGNSRGQTKSSHRDQVRITKLGLFSLRFLLKAKLSVTLDLELYTVLL